MSFPDSTRKDKSFMDRLKAISNYRVLKSLKWYFPKWKEVIKVAKTV